MGILGLVVTYALACTAISLARVPGAWRGRLRERWPALMLLGEALLTVGFNFDQPAGPCVLIIVAGLIVVIAPRLAAALAPFGLFALALYGFWIAYDRVSFTDLIFYGAVPRPYTLDGQWLPTATSRLVKPQAMAFIVLGLWMLARRGGWRLAGLRGRYAELRGPGPVPSWLLLAASVLMVGIINPSLYIWNTRRLMYILVSLAIAVVVVLLLPRIASIAAVFCLSVYAAYNALVAIFWPSVPAALFSFMSTTDTFHGLIFTAMGLGIGWFMLTSRMWPRVIAQSPQGAITQLSQRVQRLTQTRSDATDAAVAELKRIERDLHDGAQARLVALGMSLRAAEKLMLTSPEAALALVTEARETSSRALSDLRDLVRGIYPPVLADRGLADALRSLALDAPLPTAVEVDLPEDVAMPLAAAVYFAAAEALANAVRHSGAEHVTIHGFSTGSALRVEIIDDGCGGADPSRGTGLAGVERRLATFDGILAVSSPVGGPTIIVIEVPCALSSAKISTS